MSRQGGSRGPLLILGVAALGAGIVVLVVVGLLTVSRQAAPEPAPRELEAEVAEGSGTQSPATHLQLQLEEQRELLARRTSERDQLARRVAELEARLAELETELEELQAQQGAEGASTGAGVQETPREEEAWQELDAALQGRGIMQAFGSAAFAQGLERLQAALGEHALDAVLLRLQAGSTQERMYAALLLEGWADASSIPALELAATSDEAPLVRRCAAHALAVLDGSEQEGSLERIAARQGEDWGARTNAAYGLARRGQDRWMSFLIESVQEGRVSKDLELAVIGGIVDAAPRVSPEVVLPFLHTLVGPDSTEGRLWMGLAALRDLGDRSSLPHLEELLRRELPEGLKNQAREAINRIVGFEQHPLR